MTTWAYDGFDRPWRMYYPNATGSGSSATDYEQLTYDAGGLPYSQRARDNQLFHTYYDGLGRLGYVDRPGSELDVQLFYDHFGQPTIRQTVGTGGLVYQSHHDVLGRPLVQNGPLGAVTFWWDAAGRNTRIIWPDTYSAVYDYDLTGADYGDSALIPCPPC